MNILYVHRTQGKGVEGVHIMGIVNSFRKMGHTVDILSPTGLDSSSSSSSSPSSKSGSSSGSKPGSGSKSSSSSGSGSVSSPSSNSPAKQGSFLKSAAKLAPEFLFELMELAYNLLLLNRLKAKCAEKKYDLIYERAALMNFGAVRFAKQAEIPIFLEVNFTAYTPLYRERSAFLAPIAKWIDRWNFKNATHNFVVSTYLKNHLIELGIEPAKVTVTPNAADPDVFRTDVSDDKALRQFGLQGKVVIGFVGGFYPWHGLHFLVESLSHVAQKTDRFAALLVGDGPVRKELEAAVTKKNMDRFVCFAGAVPHAEMRETMAAFDIGTMPDSNEYGSPMKIYEYMAMGKAVVAADYGPLRDGIRHGENGLLFKPGSVQELANALLQLIENDAQRTEMGKKGRELVERERNWFHTAEMILEKYAPMKTERKETVQTQ